MTGLHFELGGIAQHLIERRHYLAEFRSLISIFLPAIEHECVLHLRTIHRRRQSITRLHCVHNLQQRTSCYFAAKKRRRRVSSHTRPAATPGELQQRWTSKPRPPFTHKSIYRSLLHYQQCMLNTYTMSTRALYNSSATRASDNFFSAAKRRAACLRGNLSFSSSARCCWHRNIRASTRCRQRAPLLPSICDVCRKSRASSCKRRRRRRGKAKTHIAV